MKIKIDRDWKRKLKFIKVREYSITFVYGDRRFLLHKSGGCWILYEVFLNANGYYTLEALGNAYTEKSKFLRLKRELKERSRYTLVYSQLDKEYFCIQMTACGLFEGYFESKVREIIQRNIEIQQKIDSLNSLINDLKSQIYRF